MKKLLLIIFVLFLGFGPQPAKACDDTLVMLLTAKNPNSEFSKAIRKVATYLTFLGATLKAGLKKDFSAELQPVMDAWMEFTTRYMTNPPEEAKSDKNWAAKVRQTSETIGQIRKLILAGERLKAHDQVLELSSHIGLFFEAVGINPEKQLFLETSTNLTVFEQKVLADEKAPALAALASLTLNLQNFKKIIPEVAASSAASLEISLAGLNEKIASHSKISILDPEAVEIRTIFEELRSHILMKEWFPETMEAGQEKKE